MGNYFLTTERIGFGVWKETMMEYARELWGDARVTRLITRSGTFTEGEITARLLLEIHNQETCRIQYWPIFELVTGRFIGCCGLRPFGEKEKEYELGFHLKQEFWGMGLAGEAAGAVIHYSEGILGAKNLFAGHHPENTASAKLLKKLGFRYVGESFYEPTGLCHPIYQYKR